MTLLALELVARRLDWTSRCSTEFSASPSLKFEDDCSTSGEPSAWFAGPLGSIGSRSPVEVIQSRRRIVRSSLSTTPTLPFAMGQVNYNLKDRPRDPLGFQNAMRQYCHPRHDLQSTNSDSQSSRSMPVTLRAIFCSIGVLAYSHSRWHSPRSVR